VIRLEASRPPFKDFPWNLVKVTRKSVTISEVKPMAGMNNATADVKAEE
jgi:hypothetical protein